MTYLWVLWFLFCFVKSAVKSLYWIFLVQALYHVSSGVSCFVCLIISFLFFFFFWRVCVLSFVWTSHLFMQCLIIYFTVCMLTEIFKEDHSELFADSTWIFIYLELVLDFIILVLSCFLFTLFFVILLSLHWCPASQEAASSSTF